MENKRPVLITIVVLLFIFTPLTVLGAFSNSNYNPLEENSNHEFYYKGKLWFYNEKNRLMSKYECQTEICEYTTPIVDDNTYKINYYDQGETKPVGVIDYKYTFITDGALINLYSVETGTNLQSYKAIKNYYTALEDNVYVIKNSNDVWGALSIGESLMAILPFEYDFIGLANHFNENGELKTDRFITYRDNKWQIVDNENNTISASFNDIITDYTDEYIINKKDNQIKIYSYEGYEVLSNYEIKDYIILDQYIGIVINNFVLIYTNLNEGYLRSIPIINTTGKVSLNKNGTNLEVLLDDNIIDTIANAFIDS